MEVTVTLDQFTKGMHLTQANIEKALQQGCLIVENEAKKNCPVDTGDLRRSIHSRIEGNEGIVGSNRAAAPYVELGTGIYARDGNGRKTPWVYHTADGEFHWTEGQHPQPFLEPALEDNIDQIKTAMSKALMKELVRNVHG